MVTKANLVDMFADIEVDDSDFAFIWEESREQETYEKLLKYNPNAIVLYQTYIWARNEDNDKGSRASKAWVNITKLMLIEFCRSPYWNSKLGWLMWFWVCYARHDAYYPMAWCFHYDPLNHYRHDEPMRPEGLECPLPEDPFNIKGLCFVHPEWYKKVEPSE
jgi:hypothetical protein